MFSTSLFLSYLKTEKIAKQIEYIKATSSTNQTIYDMFKRNKINEMGALITEEQTNGKGRRGNKWYSSSGKSLTFSFLIESKEDVLLSKLPLITGISIIEGINQSTSLDCQLKWPNDILYDSKKVGGILIEKKGGHFIIGIGLNVNDSNFDSLIQSSACSLSSIVNQPIERESLLAFIFNHFEKLLNKNMVTIIKKWESLCGHMNNCIKFHHANNIIEAKFVGIHKNGAAKLNINGNEELFYSGIIEL
tara:strand:+ start:312 stop:1055 length:744 start_codon:yes stop_codon:yes gene_type:complete